MPLIWIGIGVALMSACAEGRWVHAQRSDILMEQDWEQCKAEVLAWEERRKETLAGCINLTPLTTHRRRGLNVLLRPDKRNVPVHILTQYHESAACPTVLGRLLRHRVPPLSRR